METLYADLSNHLSISATTISLKGKMFTAPLKPLRIKKGVG
ncbi:hypothetical protein EDB30_11514 [Vibrio crassostreae]|nr:hypothetical protein EDB30_11514 [Vibrio crassostreae]